FCSVTDYQNGYVILEVVGAGKFAHSSNQSAPDTFRLAAEFALQICLQAVVAELFPVFITCLHNAIGVEQQPVITVKIRFGLVVDALDFKPKGEPAGAVQLQYAVCCSAIEIGIIMSGIGIG